MVFFNRLFGLSRIILNMYGWAIDLSMWKIIHAANSAR